MEEIPVPRPGPGELLLKVGAALTCGTDLKVFRRGYHARMISPPAVFGHEFAGLVAATGAGITDFREGDRVVAANSAPCGQCFYCRQGRFSLCDDLLFVNGAYAQFLLLPKRIVAMNTLRVPENLDLAEAAMTEPLACALKGIEDAGIRSGETTAVIGAGPLGLMHICLAAARGAEVIAIDMRDDRLKLAKELGASIVINSATESDWVTTVRKVSNGGRGVDKAIEAVGTAATWQSAIDILRKGGTANLFGGCPSGASITVETGRMHYEEIRLVATFHHTPATVRGALELIATGKVPAHRWIGARRPLAELMEIFREMAGGTAPPKTAVIP